MLAPYIIIITLGLLIIAAVNFFVTTLSIWYCLILSALNVVLVIGVDALLAFLVHSLPIRWFSPYKRIFKTSAFEGKFYNAVKLKKWKTLVPELGGLGNFKKSKVETTESHYLLRFLQENCCGEIVHYFCIIAGAANLLFLNYHFLQFSLPVILVNAVLNIPPIWIQRSNRPKLLRVYEGKLKREQKSPPPQEAPQEV